MKPGGSIPHSQDPSNNPYPEPKKKSSYFLSWGSPFLRHFRSKSLKSYILHDMHTFSHSYEVVYSARFFSYGPQ
jgi:hypothetical protein